MSNKMLGIVNYTLSIEHELLNTKLSENISYNKEKGYLLISLGKGFRSATYKQARLFYALGREYTEIGNKFFQFNPKKHRLAARLIFFIGLFAICSTLYFFSLPIWFIAFFVTFLVLSRLFLLVSVNLAFWFSS